MNSMDYIPCWQIDLELDPESLDLIAVNNRLSASKKGKNKRNPVLTPLKVKDSNHGTQGKNC